MRIRQDLDENFYSQGFTADTDIFQKIDLAERLTQIYADLEHGTVSILNGRWGSGKSVFSKQWKCHLEQKMIPCIYFDAFSYDYIEHPFQAVASAFVRAAKNAKDCDDEIYDRFISAASKTLKIIGAPAAKMAVRALTLGAADLSDIDSAKTVLEEFAGGFGDISESAAKALLESQESNEASFKALGDSLKSLPELLSKKMFAAKGIEYKSLENVNPFLVVIIDELDRCRPDFALGIVEILKHFFRVDGIHFVLVTNIDHLALSVDKRYGVGPASREYIQKFYDFVFNFETKARVPVRSNAARHSEIMLNAMMPGRPSNDKVEVIDQVGNMISAYDLSLRQAESVVSSIILANIDFSKNRYRPSMMVAFMAMMKSKNLDLYSRIKNRKLKWDEIQTFFDEGSWENTESINRFRNMLKFHSETYIDVDSEEFKYMSGSIFSYGFGDRLDALPYIANSVIDKFG